MKQFALDEKCSFHYLAHGYRYTVIISMSGAIGSSFETQPVARALIMSELDLFHQAPFLASRILVSFI